MGLLDDAFRDLAQTMTGLFTDTEASVTRRTITYDPAQDLETVEETTISFHISPPLPLSAEQTQALTANGNPIYGNEAVVYAASVDVEGKGIDFPTILKDKLYINIDGRAYLLVAVKEYHSGDQPALLELTIRG